MVYDLEGMKVNHHPFSELLHLSHTFETSVPIHSGAKMAGEMASLNRKMMLFYVCVEWQAP